MTLPLSYLEIINETTFKDIKHEDYLFKCDLLRRDITAININDEEKYYHLVSKLVSSLNPNIDEEENISSQESSDSKNVVSEKKKRIN